MSTTRLPFGATIPVVGITVGDRQEVAASCNPADQVTLRCVDDNPVDPNAVEVVTADGRLVGFVPASLAPRVRAHDAATLTAEIVEKVGGNKGRSIGLRIKLAGIAEPRTHIKVLSPAGRPVGEYVSDVDADHIRVRVPGSTATIELERSNVQLVTE